ncbi:MAG: hypothetical protein JO264_19825 [Acidisphaera sp.]|nr:hypothetical protein [Acidisphaera sp.]
MRQFLPLAAAIFLAAGAHAQTMTSPATPTPQLSPPPATGTTAPHRTAPRHTRRSMQERFDAANTTHDGHLTQQQAQDGHMIAVARHFSEIDTDHKGYVTIDDLHAYNRARYAQRRAARTAAPATTTQQ